MALKEKFEANGSALNPLAGTLPKGALKDPSTIEINNSFSKGRYQDYVLDTEAATRTTDQTGAGQTRTQG